MLLNWHTIDAYFLASTFHVQSSLGFVAACLGSLLLFIALEFVRRMQRTFDKHLRSRAGLYSLEKQYLAADEMEEELLHKFGIASDTKHETKGSGITRTISLEQLARGAIHTVQFALSYCITLLFTCSNGE
ncbi:Ctr copper transporter [Bisporella sp. PMI_857]|nr:Ctr copper transporter [Bisporella sp. PMI_857]